MLTLRIGLAMAIVLMAMVVHPQYQVGALSIESSSSSDTSKPFKVTHKNSGPTYDIDLRENETGAGGEGDPSPSVEKKRIAPTNGEVSQPEEVTLRPSKDTESESDEKVERPMVFHMRRIFLVPVARDNERDDERSDSAGPAAAQQPSPFGSMRPFWPFLAGPTPAQMMPSEPSIATIPHQHYNHRHHLFGEDQASRPSSAERRGERPNDEPTFDPMRMILDLMHKAINERLADDQEGGNDGGDLKKEATNKAGGGQEAGEKETGLAEKIVPQSKNETKEEIVEIEGKKFLKKSIINRHVGENIIFMTKRLIFVPLNETGDQAPITTTTTTTVPTTTMGATDAATTSLEPKMISEQEQPTSGASPTTTSSSTSTSPEQPSTERPATEVPRRPEAEETTTTNQPKVSLLDRVSEAIDKAAERIVEKAKEVTNPTTTTAAPTTTNGDNKPE